MISRWRIIFSLGILVTALLPAGAASFSGKVQLVDSKDAGVRKHEDYSGVVVWLEPRDADVESLVKPQPKVARMVQKDKKFTPHVLAIPVGGSVDFPNLDPIFHNAFSVFNGQPFDVGLYPPGKSKVVKFTHEGVVQVFCNIHPTMSAVILVLKTPLFAISNSQGEFDIEHVPAGRYRMYVYHERALAATLQAASRDVVVGDTGATTSLVISETGFLPMHHMNKFGKDYSPETKEAYPK